MMPTLPDWSRNIAPGSWGMLANDTVGDCTIAAIGHAVALWRSYNPPETFMSDAEALAAFRVVSPNGNGAYLRDVLDRWCSDGFTVGGTLDKLGGYTEIPLKDHQAIINAILQDGCVICGVVLRDAQDEGAEEPWKTIDSPIAGGHCVPLVAVTAQGPVCVTWGRLVHITWAWWDACADEAYGLTSQDWRFFTGRPVEPPPQPPPPPPSSPSAASDEATDLVVEFEGFVAHPYRDPAGVWTIGYGSTRDSAGKPVCATTPNITQEAARKLVERDLGAALTE